MLWLLWIMSNTLLSGYLTMASSPPTAEVYNTTRFEELYKGSLRPAMENLALASLFLLRLFQRHEIPSAFLGGWAVYLRGGPRMTQDVDIAVATSMSRLKTVLLGEERCVATALRSNATNCRQGVFSGESWTNLHPNLCPHRHVLGPGERNPLHSQRRCHNPG